jgi:lipid-binding SYLF domain-containing protein
MMRSIWLAGLLTLALTPVATADWEATEGDRLQERAEAAIARMRERVERSHPYFEDAYAIAVWPGITRVAFGFGGAYGKGVVIEQGEAVGTVSYWQGSSGIQAGAKNFVLVLFFKDKATLEDLKLGKIQFTGQAGVDAATVGAAGTPTYNEGVAIIPLTNLGLMAEFSAAGTKYNYKPYKD